jgi:hypothetical protein
MDTNTTTKTPIAPIIADNLNNFKPMRLKKSNRFEGRPNLADEDDRDSLPMARLDLKIT